METISYLFEEYETEHFIQLGAEPNEVLKYRIQENNLTQKDLSILGSQSVVSEILNVKNAS